MTFKETIKITITPYEYTILRKAYDFACDNIEEDLPEELYELLKKLQDVTNKLMNMSTDN